MKANNVHGAPVFTIQESCGQRWNRELLYFDISWDPGQQPDVPLHFVSPNGPLPTQLTKICRYSDGSLSKARAWVRVDLDPEEKLELLLSPGNSPAAADTPQWREVEDGFEATNSLFAVRIPSSGIYAPGEAPGPVTSVRIGEDWIGEGWMDSSAPVTLSVSLSEIGPLFVTWKISAHYETRTLAWMECTLYGGEDFVHIRENSSRDADFTFEFDTFFGFAPDHLLIEGGGEHIAQKVSEIDYGRSQEIAVVDFHSGHHQMGLSWLGLYREGASPFIGVVELNGSEWTNTSTNRVHVFVAPPDSLTIESPMQGGVKEWALVCSTTDRNLKDPDSRVCNHLSRIHQRYAEIPFQKVKEWVLDWDPDTQQRPFLQSGPGSIEAARAKVQAHPDLLKAYQEWARVVDSSAHTSGTQASALATLWIALGDDGYAHRAAEALESDIADHMNVFWNEGAYMRLIIFDGRSMKLWLQAYDVLKAGGFLDNRRDRKIRRDLAFIAYAMHDSEFFPHYLNLSDHNDPDSFFYGLGERIGDCSCPPNFHTEYYTTFGMMGCCFRTHPMAEEWRESATILFDRQLDVHFYDSGAYVESPNYQSHSFVMLNQLTLCLRRAGGRDFYDHPRMKAQFNFFCQIQTPPILLNDPAKKMIQPRTFLDAGKERLAMLPGNGNTGSDCSDMYLPAELTLGGLIYQTTDPELSRRCMATWHRAGRPIANHYNDLNFLLLSDPDLPSAEKIGLKSVHLQGGYTVLRANPETQNEVFALVKSGTATHHNDFDQGGFTLWAYGSPVASDFGYHAQHQGRSCGVGDTWKHNCVEFDGKSSGCLGIELCSPPEAWIPGDLADLLVCSIPINNFRDLDHFSYMKQIPAVPIEYRRYILFVKPGYMLVLDSIMECEYSHKWWLHAQADDVTIDGPRARFKGKLGIDLMAHFITPPTPKIEVGEWSVMKHINAVQTEAQDWRVFVAPVRPGEEFIVKREDCGRVAIVEGDGFNDTVFLSHSPFEYEGRGIHFCGRAGVVRQYADGRECEVDLIDGEMLTVE